MYLGNFSLKGGSTGLPVGTGVGLEESLNSPDFKLKAGHTADVSGGNEFTDGMSIQRDRDGYTVIIGDWKSKGLFLCPSQGRRLERRSSDCWWRSGGYRGAL